MHSFRLIASGRGTMAQDGASYSHWFRLQTPFVKNVDNMYGEG